MSLFGRAILLSIVVMAFGAGPASAQLTVVGEPGVEPCEEVMVSGHEVTGGCHVEFDAAATTLWHVYLPFKMTAPYACEWHFESQIGANGEGYATEVVLTPPHTGGMQCRHAPCDEADGSMYPWPLHIDEQGMGEEGLNLTFCLRDVFDPPGTIGRICELHVPFTALGGHNYEFGHRNPNGTPGEAFCEPNGGLTTSFELHMTTNLSSDKIEVIH